MTNIYTIGHSNQTIDNFIETLKSHQIQKVIDIRSIPKSLKNPQFEQTNLMKSLSEKGIKYEYIKELGGFKPVKKDSKNTTWKNKSFQGYADYMEEEAFKKGIEKLKSMAEHEKIAIMCAECLPWRCHRSLISDALTVDKHKVYHIMNKKTANPHTLTKFLNIDNNQLIYNG